MLRSLVGSEMCIRDRNHSKEGIATTSVSRHRDMGRVPRHNLPKTEHLTICERMYPGPGVSLSLRPHLVRQPGVRETAPPFQCTLGLLLQGSTDRRVADKSRQNCALVLSTPCDRQMDRIFIKTKQLRRNSRAVLRMTELRGFDTQEVDPGGRRVLGH